jgi:hypothetical protein
VRCRSGGRAGGSGVAVTRSLAEGGRRRRGKRKERKKRKEEKKKEKKEEKKRISEIGIEKK